MAVQILSQSVSLKRKRQESSSSTKLPHAYAQQSFFDMLPAELLERIFSYTSQPFCKASSRVEMPQSPNTLSPVQQTSLHSSLLVNKLFYTTTIPLIYRIPRLTTPLMLEQFTNQLVSYPELGEFVRELDLTNLTITLDDNWVRGVGPKLLLRLLNQTPRLRDIRIGGENGGARLHSSIWNSIFSQLQQLRNVSINDSDSRNELQDFHLTMKNHSSGSIRNLAITKSYALPEQTVRNILSSQHRLQSIDFSGSLITGDWLSSIPTTVRLEHINLSNCLGSVEEDGTNHVVDFLSSHPAVTQSLQSLNLSCENDVPSIGLTTNDMKRILTNLPAQSMKSLDLRGTPMIREQLPLLQRFINLEELHLSSEFAVRDMEQLVLSSAYSFPAPNLSLDPTQELLQLDISKTQHTSTLGPLAKSVLVCKLMQRINRVLPLKQSTGPKSKLRYLDLSSISRDQILTIMDSVLLAEESGPLEVIELGPSMLDWCDTNMKQLFRSAGWRPKNVGKRTWIERV